MSFRKSFFKNLLISGGYNYLSQLTIFVASIITSRLLKPNDFGIVGLIAIFSGFITIFSDSGLSMAVIRSGYRQTYYRGLNFLSLIIGFILCAVMSSLMYPIALFYKNKDIILPGIVIAFLFIIKSLSVVPIAVLQKELRFGAAGRILFISTLAGTIGTILMAYAGFKYWSLIWSQYITALVSFLILYGYSNSLFKKTRLIVVRKSFQFAKSLIGRLLGFNTINYWARNADNLIIGRFYGTNDLGIYNRAYMMLQMPLNLIAGIFSSVLLPSFVKHKNADGDIEKEYYFILKIISLLNIPVATILLLFPKEIVVLLWGPAWIKVADLLPYFGLLVMTQTLTSTLGNLLVVQKEEKALMYSGWISSIIMVGGIIAGSFFSITAIASFYALAYISLVLPFIVIHIFINRLNFVKATLNFWIPKIFLSLIIWFAIYKNAYNIILYTLILWILLAFWQVREEINVAIKQNLKSHSV